MPLTSKLSYFPPSEFKNPEYVDDWSAVKLNDVRRVYGGPLVLTDDARRPGDLPSGGASDSLHYLGQAFDIRTRDKTREQLFALVRAVVIVANAIRASEPKLAGVELEMVKGPTDQHWHVAFFKDGRPDRLELALD